MLSRVAHLAVLFSLVFLVQVAMPWHMLHVQAMTADQADHAEAVQTGAPCHPAAAAQNDEPVDPIAGFCEWLCAQGQNAPWFDGLVVVHKVLHPALPFFPSGSDQLPDSVPNPPPIA